MARKIITGIDIGSSTVRVVIAEERESGGLPVCIGFGSSEARGMRHGYVVEGEEVTRSVGRALRDAERNSGVKTEDVFLAVGGTGLEGTLSTGTIIVPRADTEIMEHDIDRVHRLAEDNLPNPLNKKILHTIPVEYRIDGKRVLGRPQGMRGLKLEVTMLIITCLEQHLDDLIEAVENAGVAVADVMAAPVAGSLATLSKSQKIAGCILADIGAETTSIVVEEDGLPISLEVFSLGSINITNDIALGLKIPLEEAERVKLGQTSLPIQRKKYMEIVEGRLTDLFILINEHLKKSGKHELLPAGIIFIGGGAEIEGLEEIARTALRLPSRVARIESLLHSESTVPIRNPAWSVAYGLTIFGASASGSGRMKIGGSWQSMKKALGQIFQQLLP